jgi:uncharacterized caspase-like protein
VGNSLVQLGFDVTMLIDADGKTMRSAFERFLSRIGTQDTAVVYYSGHGFTLGGKKFIAPIDVQLADSVAATGELSMDTSAMATGLLNTDAAPKILILDTHYPLFPDPHGQAR